MSAPDRRFRCCNRRSRCDNRTPQRSRASMSRPSSLKWISGASRSPRRNPDTDGNGINRSAARGSLARTAITARWS